MTDTTVSTSGFGIVKRYALLAYGAGGTVLAVGLSVVGTLLIGLAVAVFLAGFGLVEIGHDLTTGPLIISGVVLGVAGGFCLGVASESPLGRGRRLQGFNVWELGIGRTLAVLGVGFGFLFVYRLIGRFLVDLPEPLLKGAETIHAAGSAALFWVPLLGVPLSLLLRFAPTDREWVKRLDHPALYAVWLIAALSSLN